jgi:protein-export membrane protein SecD
MSHSLRTGIIAVVATLAGSAILVLAAATLWPVPSMEADGGSRAVLEIDRDRTSQRDVASREAIDRSIGIITKRLHELAAENWTVTPDGEGRIVIDLPGDSNPERLKMLANAVAKAGKLEFRLVDTTVSARDVQEGHIPPDDDLLYGTGTQMLRAAMAVKKQALLDGADLTDVQVAFDARGGEPMVNFKFNNAGALKFGRATRENVGHAFAMVLDDEVLSAPVIREPILGGAGQISGIFTVESAKNLAILLRTGALPIKFKVVEIRQVPPASARH